MYQGLDPRTRPLRWTLFATAIALVVLSTGGQAIDAVGGWLRDESERLPWYITRVTALLAYLALAGSVIYGLLLSTKLLDRITHRTVSFTLHQDLASIGLALALVHAAVLMIDRSVPYSPAELVVPFSGPYRPLWVGIGQLTLGISIVVLFSFYVRKRIGQKSWRRLHYLSFLAFVGATAHGLMAGTDTAAAWVSAGYVLMTAIVVFLFTYRIVLSLGARRPGTIGDRLRGSPESRSTSGLGGVRGRDVAAASMCAHEEVA
jgi:DMSO/TMAO reductase YedYZ heme-binding membrane subunit